MIDNIQEMFSTINSKSKSIDIDSQTKEKKVSQLASFSNATIRGSFVRNPSLTKTNHKRGRANSSLELTDLMKTDDLFNEQKRQLLKSKVEKLNKQSEKLMKHFQEEITLLEQSTKMKCKTIIFDSDINDWSQDTSHFDSIVFGKENIAIVIEDTPKTLFCVSSIKNANFSLP